MCLQHLKLLYPISGWDKLKWIVPDLYEFFSIVNGSNGVLCIKVFKKTSKWKFCDELKHLNNQILIPIMVYKPLVAFAKKLKDLK